MINYKSGVNFKNYIILERTRGSITSLTVILRAASFLEGHKSDTKRSYNITQT